MMRFKNISLSTIINTTINISLAGRKCACHSGAGAVLFMISMKLSDLNMILNHLELLRNSSWTP